MKKVSKIVLIALILAVGVSSQVFCAENEIDINIELGDSTARARLEYSSRNYRENKVGIGVMLGEPTGFSAKVWRDFDTAIDGGIAWSLTDDKHFNVHADYLWHNWDVLDDAFEIDDTGRLPLYYGVGGRFKADDDTRIGIRFVTGAAFEFSYAPFDIFFEIAPVMDIIPKTELDLNVSFGGRFWF